MLGVNYKYRESGTETLRETQKGKGLLKIRKMKQFSMKQVSGNVLQDKSYTIYLMFQNQWIMLKPVICFPTL